MLLKKIKIKNNNGLKSRLLLIGSFLLLLLGIIFIGLDLYQENKIEKVEEDKVNEFIEDNTKNSNKKTNIQKVENIDEDYIGVLEIPILNLKKGFYGLNSKNNNVEKGIELIQGSDMPNQKNGNLILASHRGNSPVAYFNDLHKLKKEDKAIVYFEGSKYTYLLKNTYEIKKTGQALIKRNENKKVLILITCKANSNKQVVFVFELENER